MKNNNITRRSVRIVIDLDILFNNINQRKTNLSTVTDRELLDIHESLLFYKKDLDKYTRILDGELKNRKPDDEDWINLKTSDRYGKFVTNLPKLIDEIQGCESVLYALSYSYLKDAKTALAYHQYTFINRNLEWVLIELEKRNINHYE